MSTSGFRRGLVVSLGIIRTGVGLSSLVWPNLAYRNLGIDAPASDGGAIVRFFGVRDAVIAAATLSRDPRVRDTGVRLGAVADAVDVAAILAGRRSGAISRRGTVVMGGAAAVFAAMGAAALGGR